MAKFKGNRSAAAHLFSFRTPHSFLEITPEQKLSMKRSEGKLVLRAANLNQLVILLTPPGSPDNDYNKVAVPYSLPPFLHLMIALSFDISLVHGRAWTILEDATAL